MGTPGYPVTVLSAASALGTPKHGTGTPDALHGTVPCTGTHKYPYHSAQRCSLHWGHPGTAVAPLVPRIAASPGDTDTLQYIMVLAPGTRRYLSHPLRGIIPCAGDTRVPLSLTPPPWRHSLHWGQPGTVWHWHLRTLAPWPSSASCCTPCPCPAHPRGHRGDAAAGARCGTCLAAVAQPGAAPGAAVLCSAQLHGARAELLSGCRLQLQGPHGCS